MSDDKLADAIDRGHRADTLLNDPLLVEMFDRYERNCIAEWTASDPLNTAFRESYYYAITAARKVREGLKLVAAHGRVARAQLDNMEKAANE